jgi:hypothetical protein
MSREDLLELFSVGNGGGDELFPGGVTDRLMDRRDFLELLEARDGVRYGVSAGVGSDTTAAAGELDSSSVSHTAMVKNNPKLPRVPRFHSVKTHFRY